VLCDRAGKRGAHLHKAVLYHTVGKITSSSSSVFESLTPSLIGGSASSSSRPPDTLMRCRGRVKRGCGREVHCFFTQLPRKGEPCLHHKGSGPPIAIRRWGLTVHKLNDEPILYMIIAAHSNYKGLRSAAAAYLGYAAQQHHTSEDRSIHTSAHFDSVFSLHEKSPLPFSPPQRILLHTSYLLKPLHTRPHIQLTLDQHTHTHTPACASMRGWAVLNLVPRTASGTVDQTPPNKREWVGAFTVWAYAPWSTPRGCISKLILL
jgi:hypothetical protein